MEFKTPKVLEKKPVIAGFDLKTIVIIIVSVLLFVFTVFVSFFMSLLSLSVGIFYVYITKKYPKKGELTRLLKYNSSTKCIRVNQQIKSLIKRN
ncbi:hypothetical protein [Aquimarina mytili]|uniref:Uncharacterized protein n=1 Tax=Aquimarina mytili TaxID=874423 RepID=A0A937A1S4_9FLAO|nr:hypothetical protein [Aquimarina mytili]MBL0683435.1 hypothetical protein [Aquimarina mytili]